MSDKRKPQYGDIATLG